MARGASTVIMIFCRWVCTTAAVGRTYQLYYYHTINTVFIMTTESVYDIYLFIVYYDRCTGNFVGFTTAALTSPERLRSTSERVRNVRKCPASRPASKVPPKLPEGGGSRELTGQSLEGLTVQVSSSVRYFYGGNDFLRVTAMILFCQCAAPPLLPAWHSCGKKYICVA